MHTLSSFQESYALYFGRRGNLQSHQCTEFTYGVVYIQHYHKITNTRTKFPTICIFKESYFTARLSFMLHIFSNLMVDFEIIILARLISMNVRNGAENIRIASPDNISLVGLDLQVNFLICFV